MRETSAEPLADRKQRVPGEFDRVARRYDLLCALNPGYAKHLALSARRLELPARARALDLCCGTGLSTRALVRAYPEAEVVALDASREMIALAARKPELGAARFLVGDAMDPAAAGAAGPFDGVLMAYGIRNVPDPDLCLARVRALLAPGGVACFHEYSVADSRAARAVWNAVAAGVIVPLGAAATGSGELFRYLRRSVLAFDGVRAFEARLRRAGFDGVTTLPMDGWQRGIVHSFLARRRA
ncbi:MAG TPA: class I SAM-dependent methyltransferase [Kofleriaceae bacterium]|nr:class I SAM-dependent methyltransferase [Kofleriaceae bacterium]